jgi:predicted metal-dependent peptidase
MKWRTKQPNNTKEGRPMKKPDIKVVEISDEMLDLAFDKALEVLRAARAWGFRTSQLARYPYYAPLAGLLRFVKVIGCDTVSVDKWGRIYFNPFFVLSFHPKFPKVITTESLKQFLESDVISDYPINLLVEILRHEIEHLFRRHFVRAPMMGVTPENHEKWNIAADLEINQHLDLTPYPQLVELIFLPKKLGLPEGLSAEEYYLRIPESFMQQWKQGKGSGGTVILVRGHKYPTLPQQLDEGGSGAGTPKDYELDPQDKDQPGASEAQIRARMEETARQIKEHAKNRGTVPADLVEIAEQILNPKINWRQLLAHLIRKSRTNAARGKEDYTFLYPNRRGEAYHPFVIPSMVQYDANAVAAVLDTSGSMSMAEIERALAEILGITRQANIKVDVYMCDAAVHKIVHDVKTFNQIKEVVGRGGTDMVEGINRALQERRRRRYSAIVVLTDGYSPFPEDPTPIPLIICLVGKNHESKDKMPSWAKVVEVAD